MTVNLIAIIILSIAFAVLFFIADYFDHKVFQLHPSFIAGISVVYFFLIVLPEIGKRLPESPFKIEIFEYLFVLIGFIFVHITEKFILQKVEKNSQKKMRKLLKKEKILESVEHNMERILTNELKNENLDEFALREIAQTLSSFNKQEEDMKSEIYTYKLKIQKHVNKDLARLRIGTDYTYHFLVGIILVGLLVIDLLSGILFFFYAFFRTIVSKTSESHIIFTDLDIYEEVGHEEGPLIKYILSGSTFIGVLIGLIIDSIFPLNLELLFIFYSFISGVILYVIVREIIPEKEKGDPIKFLIGLISFTFVILIINIFTNVL